MSDVVEFNILVSVHEQEAEYMSEDFVQEALDYAMREGHGPDATVLEVEQR